MGKQAGIESDPAAIPADELEAYLKQLFEIGDTNGDGVLQPEEMVKLLQLCGFELSAGDILNTVEAADVNGDGVIEYNEFVPAAAALLQSTKVSVEKAVEGTSRLISEVNWATVEDEELEAYFRNLFTIADDNGDGVLQPKEFIRLLRLSGLDFPDEVILEGFKQADRNQDGVIEYDEFVPTMVEIINARKAHEQDLLSPEDPAVVVEFESEPEAAELPFHPGEIDTSLLEEYLRDLFTVGDTNGDGVLQPEEMAKLLQLCGFELSAGAILNVVQAADVNGDGVIEYHEFLPAVAELLQNETLAEDDNLEREPDDQSWTQVPEDELEAYFHELFTVADENRDGVLQPKEFIRLMRLSGLNFPDEVILEGFKEADRNQDGVIEYDEFVPTMIEIINASKALGGRGPRLDDMRPDDVIAPDDSPELTVVGTQAPLHPTLPATPTGEGIPFHPTQVESSQLEGYLEQLFRIGDVNGDGVLQPAEMVKLMQLCGFELSAGVILSLVEAADVNGDGVIDYNEFVPSVVELLQNVDLEDNSPQREGEYGWADLPDSELESYFRELFMIADENRDGVLQPKEYVKLMKLSGLNFPDELILEGFQLADTNQDGVIQYHEFVPAMLELIRTQKQNQEESSEIDFHPNEVGTPELEAYLKQLFEIGDENGDGVLQPAEMVRLLKLCGFELSAGAILDTVEAADVNGDGVIEYNEFLPAVAALLQTVDLPGESSEDDEDDSWAGVPEAELEAYLNKLFCIADENRDGVLQPKEFIRLMRLSGLNFPDEVILEVFVDMDVNHDGVVEYDEFMPTVMTALRAAGALPVLRQDEELAEPEAPAPVESPKPKANAWMGGAAKAAWKNSQREVKVPHMI